jgi:hypothetical protein
MGQDADVAPTINRSRIFTTLGLALGVAIIVFSAGKAKTGADEQNLPEGIEAVRPEAGSQVLEQTQITVDLSAGYDGVLYLQGTQIPDDQVAFDAGQNELSFPCQPANANDPGAAAAAGSSGATDARPAQPRCVRGDPNAELVSIPKGTVAVRVEYWKIAVGRAAGSKTYFWDFQAT